LYYRATIILIAFEVKRTTTMTRTAAPRAVARPAKRLSAALSALCLAFAVVLPVLSLALLALEPELLTEGLGLPASSAGSAASTFSAIQRVLIVVIGFVPIAFMTYALVCAHLLQELRSRRLLHVVRRQEPQGARGGHRAVDDR